MRTALLLSFLLVGAAYSAESEPSPTETAATTTYHSDPDHLWNRLNQTLFRRTAVDGKTFGLDAVDILYWFRTEHLLTGSSHKQALSVLDEFLEKRGEKLIRDPLKRAFLQRDLWQLFDWAANPYNTHEPAGRTALQLRLAKIIRRLALTKAEIASLPDNYSAAVKNSSTTNLPPNLFEPKGPWISVGRNGEEPTALVHARDFGGRSVFEIMMRHPEGATAADHYLTRLQQFTPAVPLPPNSLFDPAVPQFPPGTQWALARRMCLIDDQGEIQPTPIIETIQIRTYHSLPAENSGTIAAAGRIANSQEFQEFVMTRTPGAALADVKDGERGFPFVHFRGKGIDVFENHAENYEKAGWNRDSSRFGTEILKTCTGCHSLGPGIMSVNVFTRFFLSDQLGPTTDLAHLDRTRESELTLLWKKRQFDWGLLNGIWRQDEHSSSTRENPKE